MSAAECCIVVSVSAGHCYDSIIQMDYFFFVTPSYLPFVPLYLHPLVPDLD